MTKNNKTKPTESELEILQVLWEKGPGTVRQVNEELNKKRTVGYTTSLKLMQIMTTKGLLNRNTEQKTHIYHPAIKREEIQQQLLDRLLNTAFGGSAQKLVMQALGNHKASKSELEEIKNLIDEIERKK